MKITRYILLTIVSLSALVASAADNGVGVMKCCAAKFRSTPSVVIDFSLAHSAGSDNGKMTMSKDMFSIITPQLSTWFDGKTQWTYIADNNEVNITEPTGEELMDSNPFELINSFESAFDCKLMSSTASSDVVLMTPRDHRSSISSAKVTISKSTGWPTAITVVFGDKRYTSIAINKVTPGAALTSSTFQYKKALHPDAEIIDLR